MKTLFAVLTFFSASAALGHGYSCLLEEPEYALISSEFQLLRIDGGQAVECDYIAPETMHCQISNQYEYTVDFGSSLLEKIDVRNGEIVYSAEMNCLY